MLLKQIHKLIHTFRFSILHLIAGTFWQSSFSFLAKRKLLSSWLELEHFFIISTRHLEAKKKLFKNELKTMNYYPAVVLRHLFSLYLPWIVLHHFMCNFFISAHCFIFRDTHSTFPVNTFCLTNKFGHWSRPYVYYNTKIKSRAINIKKYGG